jgi:hypothetical protein
MFSSTISFGYATPEQVENTLDEMLGEDSRKTIAKMNYPATKDRWVSCF